MKQGLSERVDAEERNAAPSSVNKVERIRLCKARCVFRNDRSSCLFGDVIAGATQLTSAGESIKHWWYELKNKFAIVDVDEFVIMPNHLHGIIMICDSTVGADLGVGPQNPETGAHVGAPLPKIVQWFKTMTTNEYIRGVKELGWLPFRGQLWQRSYYDHVIRDDDSLNRIRQYIIDNPARWEFDRENPRYEVEPEAGLRTR